MFLLAVYTSHQLSGCFVDSEFILLVLNFVCLITNYRSDNSQYVKKNTIRLLLQKIRKNMKYNILIIISPPVLDTSNHSSNNGKKIAESSHNMFVCYF